MDLLVLEATEALNSLAGYSTPTVARAAELDAISFGVWQRLRKDIVTDAPSAKERTAQEACSVLLGFSSGPYHESTPVATFARSAIAWPVVGTSPRSVVDRLPPCLGKVLEGRSGGLVRTPAQVRAARLIEGVPNLHGDPSLAARRSDYVWFCREGKRRGMLQ